MSHGSLASPPNPANAPSARFFGGIGIAPGARVLDVGCGQGDLSRYLAELVGPGGEVVGIDRSEDALASARSIDAAEGGAPIQYRAVDLSGALPDIGRFDAIVGRRVLMYLPDAAAALAQLPLLTRAMLPRMMERGIATIEQVDPDTLSQRIEEEHRAVGGAIVWDLAFLIVGRVPRDER